MRNQSLTLSAGALALLFVLCQPASLPAQTTTARPPVEVEVEVGTTTAAPVAATPTPAPQSSDTVSKLETEPDAARSAEKLVPAPGTAMDSTEQRTLEGTGDVAKPPPLRVQPDGKVSFENGTTATEAVAIKSAAELMRMLGVRPPAPKPAQGYESDEESTATKFDVDAIQKLIGREPTVVYRVVVDGTPLPDPMIVPWIRNQKLLEENFNKAMEKLANNELEEGRSLLLDIVTQYPNTDYGQQAREILDKIIQIQTPPVKKEAAAKTPAPVDIQINPSVKIGTVIADPSNPEGNRVMINGKVYKVGDAVYNFPNHRITAIAEDKVTVEVEQQGQKKQFDVPVRPAGPQ